MYSVYLQLNTHTHTQNCLRSKENTTLVNMQPKVLSADVAPVPRCTACALDLATFLTAPSTLPEIKKGGEEEQGWGQTSPGGKREEEEELEE